MMKVDIVAPVYNEEDVIGLFLRELDRVIHLCTIENKAISFELILVDDGSTDTTAKKIIEFNGDLKIRLISLSRNFGHQNAVWAGIESVRDGAHCVVMDSDLQDPPILLRDIVESFSGGIDVVLMQRRSRQDNFSKRFFASMFYLIYKRLSGEHSEKNVGDFFGLSPVARRSLLMHQEYIKYLRGLVGQIGHSKKIIPYDRQSRASGYTHYTLRKMFSLAVAGVTGFSIQPLIWVVYLSAIGGVIGFYLILYILYLKTFTSADIAPGWAFSIVSATFLSIVTLVSLSILAVYIARIVQELKNRPVYLIKENESGYVNEIQR